jgi:hypothetical protein
MRQSSLENDSFQGSKAENSPSEEGKLVGSGLVRPPFRRVCLGREPGQGVGDRPASRGDGSARCEMRAIAGLGDRQRDVVPAAHLKMRGSDALAGFEIEPVGLPGKS